jgi:hypothetical protein
MIVEADGLEGREIGVGYCARRAAEHLADAKLIEPAQRQHAPIVKIFGHGEL